MELFDDLNSIKGALSKAPDEVKNNFNKILAYFSEAPERTVTVRYIATDKSGTSQEFTKTMQIKANSDDAAKNSAKGLVKGFTQKQGLTNLRIKEVSVD